MTKPTIITPSARPKLPAYKVDIIINEEEINRDLYPVVIVGIRGYYLNTLGRPAQNDRGIYDDALFISSPYIAKSFNGNTDPSHFRRGAGKGRGKGMATLKPGFWPSYTFGKHRNHSGLALVQRAGPVTVIRDGNPDYEDTGFFGINFHRGGRLNTNSEGCQTTPPDQWRDFIETAIDEAQKCFGSVWETAVIPYLLTVQK